MVKLKFEKFYCSADEKIVTCMTVASDTSTSEFTHISASTGRAHWLPFRSKSKQEMLRCDVDGYFVVNEHEEGFTTSTFRGRALKGIKVDTHGFEIVTKTFGGDEAETRSTTVNNLVVWNHDDMPLKSDVVPQAIALARIQQALGST